MPSLFSRIAVFGCCFALLACGSQASAAVVAKAVGPLVANDLNVNSFTIGVPSGQESLIAGSGNWIDFPSSPGDGFGLMAFDSGNETTADLIDGNVPFALLDDSAGFPADVVGIVVIDSSDQTGDPLLNDFDNFFGASDTINDDNGNTGSTVYTATWDFDITGASGGLAVKLDAAAMGDFENIDVFDFEYSLDGGAFSPLFTSEFDDTDGFYTFVSGGSNIDLTVTGQDPSELPPEIVYQLDAGTFVGWKDPMKLNGTFLNNSFQTLTQGIGTTAATSLQVRFSATTNGGTEAFAFRNLIVEDGVAAGLDGDYNGDLTVDAADYTVWRDGDSPDSTIAGYDLWVANFGNSSLATAVPEPATALLLMIGLAGLATRRNG